jgi:hypothetical protein
MTDEPIDHPTAPDTVAPIDLTHAPVDTALRELIDLLPRMRIALDQLDGHLAKEADRP